jgi:hypothetical protein
MCSTAGRKEKKRERKRRYRQKYIMTYMRQNILNFVKEMQPA